MKFKSKNEVAISRPWIIKQKIKNTSFIHTEQKTKIGFAFNKKTTRKISSLLKIQNNIINLTTKCRSTVLLLITGINI